MWNAFQRSPLNKRVKLAFIVDGYDSRTAIGKFILSFCRELLGAFNIDPTIITAYTRPYSPKELPKGVNLVAGAVVDRPITAAGWQIFMDYYFGFIGAKLAKLVRKTDADCYLHVSTCGWSVTKAKNDSPMGFLCNGLAYATFFSEPWYQDLGVNPAVKLLMRLSTPLISSKVHRLGRGFDFYLSNSHFTMEHLFLHLGYHSQTVHLPVDVETYSPGPKPATDERYLLSVGNSSEIEVDTVEYLAKHNRVVRVGRRAIPNCDNRGFVTNQELVELYRSATATLFPHYQEPFGMVPVESMACGTPVLTYDCQGPGETVENGVTGWTVETQAQLLEKAGQVLREGVSAEMRRRCRAYVVERFSPRACTESLVAALESVCDLGIRGSEKL
jgi:glycosyltransferase involved in cell wall biosynthesis